MIPVHWEKIKLVRQSESCKLKACSYIKPEVVPRPYQAAGALNILLSPAMMLGDGAGLGKTLQAIAGYALAKASDPTLKLLVVTVKASAPQWGEEMAKFTTGLTWHVMKNEYKPEGAKRKLSGIEARDAQYEAFKGADVLICHYHTARDDFKKLIENRKDRYMVVFDEVQECKNPKSQNFEAAYQLSEHSVRRYGLSATPIKNRLLEFYWLLAIIVPGLFTGKGKGITNFKDTYCIQQLARRPGRGGRVIMVKEVTGYKNLEDFRNKILPWFLIRRTSDVAKDLPSIISKRSFVELAGAQKKLYAEAKSGALYEQRLRAKYYQAREDFQALADPSVKQIETFYALQERFELLDTKDGKANSKGAALMLCQMVANGPQWLDEAGESTKLAEFKRLMEDEYEGRNVIVFTRFASGIKYMEEVLDSIGRKHVKVSGAEDDAQRVAGRVAFQDPNDPTDVMIITQAGSASLNLQSASVVMFYDTPWSYGDLYQIIGRAQRIGSVHANILVHHLVVQGSIDEHVLALLSTKKDLNDDVVGDTAKGALMFSDGVEDSVASSQGESFEDALYRSIFG